MTPRQGALLHRLRVWERASPITLRIFAVNVLALLIFVGGILYLTGFRQDLVERRTAEVRVTAEIIANALAESAAAGPNRDLLDPPAARGILNRLVTPTKNRARIFDVAGTLVADSAQLSEGAGIYREPLPPLPSEATVNRHLRGWVRRTIDFLTAPQDYPPSIERPSPSATYYWEAKRALMGEAASAIRQRSDGLLVISVAVPIQRFRHVMGALLITYEAEELEAVIREQRRTLVEVFIISLGITGLLSLYLSVTIAQPLRRLAAAAETVRRSIGREAEFPLFRERKDEIGALSRSLNDMTAALYRQIDAVGGFASDVAHELKNPLSSIRSALESFSRTKDRKAREKLTAIVLEDVRRLDRLITDISDASRLDAELSRAQMEPIDLAGFAGALAGMYAVIRAKDGGAGIAYAPPGGSVMIEGIPDRLSQVIRNLVDNALSFSPLEGTVRLAVTADGKYARLAVEDDGPGLPPGVTEKIFERFYSERPEGEAFGRHSGLGLAIARQIIESHGGTIAAENRLDDEGCCIGARFTVTLPLKAE